MSIAETVEAVECPSCQGRGKSEGLACGPSGGGWRVFECFLCKGTGTVPPVRIERMRVGDLIRRERLERDQSGREESLRIGVDKIEFNHLEFGRGPLIEQFSQFRKDGWPLCPRCEEDELYSNAGMAYAGQGPRPTLAQDYFSGFGCYRCNWKSK